MSQYDEVESHNPRYVDKIERHGCIKCGIFSDSDVIWNRRVDTIESVQPAANSTKPAIRPDCSACNYLRTTKCDYGTDNGPCSKFNPA